jgi:hypothetical protein
MPDRRQGANPTPPASREERCRRSGQQRRFSPHHTGVEVHTHPPEPSVGRLRAHTEHACDLGPRRPAGERCGDRTVTCRFRFA